MNFNRLNKRFALLVTEIVGQNMQSESATRQSQIDSKTLVDIKGIVEAIHSKA